MNFVLSAEETFWSWIAERLRMPSYRGEVWLVSSALKTSSSSETGGKSIRSVRRKIAAATSCFSASGS